MEKLLFRKLITDISLRALIITFTLGSIVWIVQAVNYLDFVIDDGHNFRIYFYYNLFNFPKIVHRILPFVLFISIFFELIKYEKNNELIIFWINGISKKNFILNLAKFSLILMSIQIIIGSIISPSSQFKSRLFLKESNMDFLPNLIKPGKFIDTISGLTIFINEKTTENSYKNIFIQEGNLFDLDRNNQIIFAKEGFLVDNKKKIFRLLSGKIIGTNNKKLISFQFDKIDYNLSKFTSKTITVPKIQELSSLKIIKCSFNLMTNNSYQDEMFDCNIERLKNLNNELYKRFIKPFYIPLLTLICCFLIIFSKEQNNYTLKTIKVFLSVFLILVISETLMRYVDNSLTYLVLLMFIPIIFYIIGYILLIKKVRYG